MRRGRGDHSSMAPVTRTLVQPTRMIWPQNRLGPKSRVIPIWSCSRWGLPCGSHCWSPGALLPHPFTLTDPKAGGLLSVALSLGSPPPAVNRHRVSKEPGLSSSSRLPHCQRSPGQLAGELCWSPPLPSSRQCRQAVDSKGIMGISPAPETEGPPDIKSRSPS